MRQKGPDEYRVVFGIISSMHSTRLDIMRALRKSQRSSFADLQRDVAETSDNLTYHLRYLMREKYIQSPLKGVYCLAPKGEEFINTNQDKYDGIYPTVSVMLVVKDTEGRRLLMRKRKLPHIGKLHDVTFGLWSSSSVDQQIREFCQKYDLQLKDIHFCGVFRKRIGKESVVRFDKVFLVHKAVLCSYVVEIEDRNFELIPAPVLDIDKSVLESTKSITELVLKGQGLVDVMYVSE